MKNNAPRRKLVEDAIDLYTPSIGIPKEGDAFMEIPIARIKPYHDHPFQLYAGDRSQPYERRTNCRSDHYIGDRQRRTGPGRGILLCH